MVPEGVNGCTNATGVGHNYVSVFWIIQTIKVLAVPGTGDEQMRLIVPDDL